MNDKARKIVTTAIANMEKRTPLMIGAASADSSLPFPIVRYEKIDTVYPSLSSGEQALLDILLSLDGYKEVSLRFALMKMDDATRDYALDIIAAVIDAQRGW